MKKIWLIVLAVTGLLILTVAGFVVRDGATVTPVGEGTITLEAGTFEVFPLPQFAAKHISEDYKSYFVEVEPGIKCMSWKSGQASLSLFNTVIPRLDFSIGRLPRNCQRIGSV